MKAMRLHKQGSSLVLEDLPIPEPGPDEVLIKVSTCAVCRTDLHVCDGDLKKPKLPLIPGHEIVGYIVDIAFLNVERAEHRSNNVLWGRGERTRCLLHSFFMICL